MHKERKETTHEEIVETVITTSIYIYIYIYQNEYKVCYHNVRTMYIKRKDTNIPHYIPQKENTPLTKISPILTLPLST